MYPMYRDMNSCPYQTPPAPSNFPSWEAFRPLMKEDGANTRPMPEYWPSNYGYPAPTPCQNCCSHGQQPQPSYSNFRPSCPHFPMPAPYGHYYGGYPAPYPQPYPYPYVPPPHYSMEMPRYEFDKGSLKGFHCCECPNHPSHVKSTSNVKIEEQDPDVETKKAASLIPTGMTGSPNPLMWCPPGYMMNKEQPRRIFERGNLDEPQVLSNAEKPKKSVTPVEQDTNVRYQWLPLDMNSIKRLMEGGDEKKVSDVEKKDQNKQFPYPIIWMPYGGQGEDQTRGQEDRNIDKSSVAAVEGKNKAKLPVEERCPTFKLLKHPDGELLKEGIESGDDAKEAGIQGGRKTGVVKTIPVKQLDQLDDPVPKPLKKEEGELNKSAKNVEPVKNSADMMKLSSPTKKSKLPPICLRVDPPRKKNGKGSSRSPSPPGEKRHQASSGSKEERKDEEKMGVAANDATGNDVGVPNVAKQEKGPCILERGSEAEEKVVHTSDSSKLNATVSEDNAVHPQGSEGAKESEYKESGVPESKILSETEAAVILQSAFRGYAVRRWEPLTKLRHIYNIKEEARKIGERVEKIESCVTVNDKEKVAIGEMIMNLLLKLDTIQGLHPSVREVRKSVATELIRLQEKLDSIVSQVSISAGPCSAPITGVEKEPNALGSDEELAGSFEITNDVSETSALDSKEGEEANKEEFGRESHNEEEIAIPPSGSSSEMSVSCLEKKEIDPEEIITSLEDPSMENRVDVLADQKPLRDTPGRFTDEDREGKQDAEVSRENVENDILRMEWECDLGAVKINRKESEEIEARLQLADISCPAEKRDEEEASALEVERDAEEHEEDIEIEASGNCYKEREMDQHQPIQKPRVQGNNIDHGSHLAGETTDGIKYTELVENSMRGRAPFLEPVIEVEKHIVRDSQVTEPVDSEDTRPQSDTRLCYEDQDENLNESPQESLEDVEDDICRMEWECDMGAAKFSPGVGPEEVQVHVLPRGIEKQASEAENNGTEDQLDQLSENRIITESSDTENTETREFDTTTGILDMDARESEISEGQAVPSLEPVIEVEKQMVTELPASECSLNSSTFPTSTQQYEEQINRDETNRRIIEENEKLRGMVEQLLASGKDQQNVISTLTAKVSALEKKLPKRRTKTRSGKRPRVILTRNGS